ncbi:RNA-directed DNA polymerase, eukaryota, reverse transcriptase zinc-binding domain protein [Tanacetum coccineum]|uniref:RNA-directed DNA polymerase, eukaryota, reverse transcriptase zinc-binding domain protein n=1 Tax=Tanacetum coccineum TaxID=301880 RepID=A0ABQ5GUB5_9ASTR
MDTMTANMCHNVMGRLDFARVLVEMDADKEFKQTIEVQYRDNNNKEKWEEDRRHENERNVLNETEEGNMEDDVLDDEIVFIWNIRGMSNGNKKKEVMKFINDGKLQSILYHVENIQGKVNLFYSFVYASNNCKERRILWKDMYLHKRICGNNPWVIMGDMNVTLNLEEHSNGGSVITEEM